MCIYVLCEYSKVIFKIIVLKKMSMGLGTNLKSMHIQAAVAAYEGKLGFVYSPCSSQALSYIKEVKCL